MLDLVVVDGQARGIVARNLVTGEIERYAARRRRPRHRRLRQRLLPLDQRGELQRDGDLARAQARRLLRQPVLHADPPDLHPGQRRLPVEAHADEREPAQRRPRLGADARRATSAPPDQIPEAERDYFLERRYPAFGNLVPRDVASRARRRCATRATASARPAARSTSTSPTPSSASARDVIRDRYGNLFDMYQEITDEDPVPGADADLPAPALHDGRALGGLQPDEHHPRPVRARRGELLRPRRQPPRRERADAGPRRRLLRDPVHDRRLPRPATPLPKVTTDHAAFDAAEAERERAASTQLLSVKGQRDAARDSTGSSARSCGTTSAWPATTTGLREALAEIPRAARGVLAERAGARARRATSTRRSRTPAASPTSSSSRELMALDALERAESCGGHFREEHQTAGGRGAARRRELRLRRRLGVHRGRRATPVPPQGTARVRERASRRQRSYK